MFTWVAAWLLHTERPPPPNSDLHLEDYYRLDAFPVNIPLLCLVELDGIHEEDGPTEC